MKNIFYIFRSEEDSSITDIKHHKFQAIYNQKGESKCLTLFILFNSSTDDWNKSEKLCEQICDAISQFRFEFLFILNTDMKYSKESILKQIDEKLISIEQQGYNCLITFLIGKTAPVDYSNGKLCYKLKRDDNNIIIIALEEIQSLIYTKFSELSKTVPTIILNTCISQDIPNFIVDGNFCTNTFLCYASNNVTTLPQGVYHHQLVQSLYEVLNTSIDESLLLIELFIDVRDHYFKCFPIYVKDTFNENTTFYCKNTIRYQVLMKHVESNNSTKSRISQYPPGFLLFVYNSALLKVKIGISSGLMNKVKNFFQNRNYSIGEDILLMDKQTFIQGLNVNSSISQKCRLILILVLNEGSSSNQILFDDGTNMNVDIFSFELTEAFPRLPKVVFISQEVEPLELDPPLRIQQYEHMLIVNSIEPNLSDNSLIMNFALEIKRNYFAELHQILQSSIVNTTNSLCIQVLDGFKNNFYINYHCHLSQLLNSENSVFREHFEKACLEGSEPFKFYRLMVVGPEGVGKTSLLRALTGKIFQSDEQTTAFLGKYDLHIQKMSHDWSQTENFNTYITNIEETRQDLAMKAVAHMYFAPHMLSVTIENKSPTIIPQNEATPSETKSRDSLDFEESSKPAHSEVMHEFLSGKMIKESLDRIHSLSSKSDFLTAWDFAGQNYLYCFYSIFLSPRSVYIIPIDLTIRDLFAGIMLGHKESRYSQMSNSGAPRTYLEVYEFWLNTIYSISKSSLSHNCYSAAKIIFVFTKADQVENAKYLATKHIETLKSNICKSNNAFSLVHEEDGLFLLSCKTNSEYFDNFSKLKATIKRVSDQVAYNEPIPIKWLKLANEIFQENEPILDQSRVKTLADKSNCSEDIEQFLHFFHEIGFFFYKHGKIIIDIKSLFSVIYNVFFPQSVIETSKIVGNTLIEIQKNLEEGKISMYLFDVILNVLNLYNLKEALLKLLQLFGILIRCRSGGEISVTFHVPCLLTGSLNDIKQCLPHHTHIASFFVYFPDGFLPASLYFTLLSECIKRNDKEEQPHSILGFDCAVFSASEALLVEFDYFTDRTKILVNFYSINSLSSDEEEIISELLEYLIFLQLSIAQIQTTLIPCDNLANIMFLCDSCDTLSMLSKGFKVICSLDTILSSDVSGIELLIEKWDSQIPSSQSTGCSFRKIFCCKRQLNQTSQYIRIMDSNRPHYKGYYNNTVLSEFILNNKPKFIKYINWKELLKTLYVYDFVSLKRYSVIIDKDPSLKCLSEEMLTEFVCMKNLGAIKFYLALHATQKDRGNHNLVKIIEKHMNSVSSTVEVSTVSPRHLRQSLHLAYNMNSARHGIAFIVNIEYFGENSLYKKRDGSKHDIVSLTNVFDQIQYDTKVFEGLTRKEFLKVLKLIRSLNHSEYDSFFCIIMSHGNDRGEIIFANNKPLSKSKIVSEFSPRYCKALESKPRIFIFQACRGKEEAAVKLGMEGDLKKGLCSDSYIDESSLNPVQESFVPISTEIDTFIGDSTVNQYVSYRSESKGTFFIQSFCSVMESCSTMEFTHIMMEVRRKVTLFSKGYRQCTEDTNRLQGQVYF